MTTFDLTDEDLTELDMGSTRTENGGSNPDRRECPDCGRDFKVNADGTLRAHNCGGVRNIKRTKPGRGKTKRTVEVPKSVQRVGTAAVATGVEWTARQVVASYIPCRPSQIPDEVVALPDADGMVGPLVKFTWPQLPAKAQSVVASICDHEDMIVAMLAWWDWFNKLQKFAANAHEVVAEQRKMMERTGTDGGIQGQTQEPTGGRVIRGGFGTAEPFVPVTG